MAVDLDDREAEGLQLFRDGVGAHDLVDGAVDLKAVVVHDGAEIVQLVVGGEHQGLPDLTLLDLAVPQQGVDPAGLAHPPGGKGHSGGAGDPLTQGAGGHVHSGHGVHVGVSLKVAVDVPQGGQVVHREEAPVCQGGVEPRGGVALGQDEPVPVLPLGIFRVHIQFLEIEVGKQVGGGQTSARVTGLGAVGALDDAHAHPAGHSHQLLFLTGCHRILLCGKFCGWDSFTH